jgi:hypothetical protein
MYRYAECIDAADFAGLAALFAHGRIRSSAGRLAWLVGDEVRAFYSRTNHVREDGAAHTSRERRTRSWTSTRLRALSELACSWCSSHREAPSSRSWAATEDRFSAPAASGAGPSG